MNEIVVDENLPDDVVADVVVDVKKVFVLAMLTLKIVENAVLVSVANYSYCPN